MVYSRSLRTRVFIEVAVVCALGLSAFPSTHAEGSTSSDPSATVTACGISDGDKSVGIRVIDDSTCVAGGLGCYNDHCRFCKVLDTPQSTAFTNCSLLGADFPTMAPLVVSTSVCEVSSGDAAVGISAMTDLDCVYGGLGCFNDHCRFCKVQSTPQSSAFVDCSGGDSTSDTPSTTTTAPDASSDASDSSSDSSSDGLDATTDAPDSTSKAPALTTDAPVSATDAPDSTSEAPAPTTDAPVSATDAPDSTSEAPAPTTDAPVSTTDAPAVETTCSLVPAAGDVAVGITIGTDPTCSSGGIGCINDVCRFCRLTTSLESAPFVDCTSLAGGTLSSETPSGTSTPSPPDATETPITTTDATASPTDTPPATTETPDATTGVPATTDAPTTTDAPASTTDAPTTQTTCSIVAAAGDVAVGINIATDPTCSSGGVGCIDNICRFCKVTTSVQSAAFVDCSLFGGDASTEAPTDVTAPPSDTTTEAPSTTTEAPSATTEVPSATTEVPSATTEAPSATTETPVVAATPDASTDASDWIFDASEDSDAMDTTSEAPDATTDSPDATPEAPATTTVTPVAQPLCTQVASSGDASVGIKIATDTTCSSGGAGCIDDVCRFCKLTTTVQSAAFVDCALIEGSTDATTEPPTDIPATTTEAPVTPTETPAATTEAPVAEPACTQVASSGDASVGIKIVTDTTCSSGGAGCIDDVCRFCKLTTTVQSAAFVDCALIEGSTPSANALTDTNVALFDDSKVTLATAEQTSDGVTNQFQKLFNGSPVQIGAGIAGCVGVAAVVAMMAIAAKRALARRTPSYAQALGAEDDEQDAESGQSVVTASSVEEPSLTVEA